MGSLSLEASTSTLSLPSGQFSGPMHNYVRQLQGTLMNEENNAESEQHSHHINVFLAIISDEKMGITGRRGDKIGTTK